MSWVRTVSILVITTALGTLLASCGSRGTKLVSPTTTPSSGGRMATTAPMTNPLTIGANYPRE